MVVVSPQDLPVNVSTGGVGRATCGVNHRTDMRSGALMWKRCIAAHRLNCASELERAHCGTSQQRGQVEVVARADCGDICPNVNPVNPVRPDGPLGRFSIRLYIPYRLISMDRKIPWPPQTERKMTRRCFVDRAGTVKDRLIKARPLMNESQYT